MIQLHPIEAESRQFHSSRHLRGILCQREAELAYCGWVESPLTQNSSRTSRLQNARCRCESDEGLKVEIPN